MTQTIKRIGVVSDTHADSGRALAAELLDGLSGVDLILHAGDITAWTVLEALAKIAPVVAVHGNCDQSDVRAELPPKRVVAVSRWRIGLWHGSGGLAGLADRAQGQFQGEQIDAVVFGHSHHPWERCEDSVLRFNPGSAAQPRFTDTPSFGILTLGETIESAVILLP